ncbi:MAG: hypothetical protein JO264_15835 [Acidisphaera sp.]|nr:hypothetical protein [Acidisphaera sp.]
MGNIYRVTRTTPVYLTSPAVYIQARDEDDAEGIAHSMFARGEWPEGEHQAEGEPRYDVACETLETDAAIAVLKTYLKATPAELTEKRDALRLAIEALRNSHQVPQESNIYTLPQRPGIVREYS